MTTTPETPRAEFDAAAIAAEALARGEDPLQSVVGQLVGYSSTCWENLSETGVFESTRAKNALDSTLAFLRAGGVTGRTVTVSAEQRLVLRLTDDDQDVADLVRNVDDLDNFRVLLVAPVVEAYVLEPGARVLVEARESWLERLHSPAGAGE